MNRLIIVFIALITISVAANAQFFVEGIVGLQHQGGKESNGGVNNDSPSFLTIDVSPKVGYQLSDGIMVGANPFFLLSTEKLSEDSETKTQIWGFSVFGRYRLLGTEKLSLFAENSISIGKGFAKGKTDSNITFSRAMTNFMVSVYPVVLYDLSDKFSIIGALDFLSVDFVSSKMKDDIYDRKVTTNQFGFNLQSLMFNRLGNIGIGFIYNF